MPSAKRKPITYTPAGGSIFRPADQVEQELAAVEEPTGRPDDRSNERPDDRTPTRGRVRHSFDIRADQLDALYALQEARRKRYGKKPTMGQLVEAALDTYLASGQTRE